MIKEIQPKLGRCPLCDQMYMAGAKGNMYDQFYVLNDRGQKMKISVCKDCSSTLNDEEARVAFNRSMDLERVLNKDSREYTMIKWSKLKSEL